MRYSTLNQRNPAYCEKLWEKLDDLYEGGFQIIDHAAKYIPKHVNERDDMYRERLAHAEYTPYLGMIVDAYAANLFAQEPIVSQSNHAEKIDEYWQDFATDANLQGDDISRVMRDVFTSAVLKRRGLIACDFPAVEEKAETRAEEDALGATRGYAFEVLPEELLDWEYDGVIRRRVELKSGAKVDYTVGLYKFAVLRRVICTRENPEDDRSTFVEEFRIWRMIDGKAWWFIYRTAPRKPSDPPPKDDDEIQEFGKGETSFQQIPLVEMNIPPGLWLGNKLGPMALALFRRRSALMASEDRSLFPVAVVKLGPDVGAVGGALPPDIQQNPNRGRTALTKGQELGAVELGYQDDFDFVEPKGTAQKLVDEQLKDSVDEFFRVAHMMASSIAATSSGLGRSGRSKEQDHRAMTIVLEAYGAIVKDALLRVHRVIAEARGEQIDWKVIGLDKFDTLDRAIILEEAKSMSAVSIPSKTFRTHWQTKVALALLGDVSPEVQSDIEDEIEAGVEAEELMRDLMTERSNPGEEDPRGPIGGFGRSGPPRAGTEDGEGATPQ